MPKGESERTLAECLDCESVYAAKKWADGTIRPIGMRDGCHCGSTEFRVLEKSTTPRLREEEID